MVAATRAVKADIDERPDEEGSALADALVMKTQIATRHRVSSLYSVSPRDDPRRLRNSITGRSIALRCALRGDSRESARSLRGEVNRECWAADKRIGQRWRPRAVALEAAAGSAAPPDPAAVSLCVRKRLALTAQQEIPAVPDHSSSQTWIARGRREKVLLTPDAIELARHYCRPLICTEPFG